jgi:hypothetical protein
VNELTHLLSLPPAEAVKLVGTSPRKISRAVPSSPSPAGRGRPMPLPPRRPGLTSPAPWSCEGARAWAHGHERQSWLADRTT